MPVHAIIPSTRWLGLLGDLAHIRQPSLPTRRKLRAARTFFFASYARDDATRAQAVFDAIEADGHILWIDHVNLPPGGLWTGDIVAAIRGCKAMLLLCSSRSFASRDVLREVAAASRFGKPIVPVFLDGAEMPDEFAYYLSVHQAIRLSETGWRTRLLCALDVLAKGAKFNRRRAGIACPPTLVGTSP